MLYQGIIGGGSSPVEPQDLSPVLLWTNNNIGTPFTAQTVNLDLTDYAGVIVEFNRSASSDAQTFANRSFIKKGETGLGGGNTVAVTAASRNVSCSNTGVTFEGGYSGTTANDNAVIPTKIYGVKEYVVEPVSNYKIKKLGSISCTQTNQRPMSAETKTYDISEYGNITVDNVFVVLTNLGVHINGNNGGITSLSETTSGSPQKSISGNTLTVSVPYWYQDIVYALPTYDIYIVY